MQLPSWLGHIYLSFSCRVGCGCRAVASSLPRRVTGNGPVRPRTGLRPTLRASRRAADRSHAHRLEWAALPGQVCRPVVHQASPALEEIAARIGRLYRVAYRMGERGLDHFTGCVCLFCGPIPEARPEPMRHGGDAEFFDQFRQRNVRERLAAWTVRNTRSVPSLRLRASCRISSARPESGTR